MAGGKKNDTHKPLFFFSGTEMSEISASKWMITKEGGFGLILTKLTPQGPHLHETLSGPDSNFVFEIFYSFLMKVSKLWRLPHNPPLFLFHSDTGDSFTDAVTHQWDYSHATSRPPKGGQSIFHQHPKPSPNGSGEPLGALSHSLSPSTWITSDHKSLAHPLCALLHLRPQRSTLCLMILLDTVSPPLRPTQGHQPRKPPRGNWLCPPLVPHQLEALHLPCVCVLAPVLIRNPTMLQFPHRQDGKE